MPNATLSKQLVFDDESVESVLYGVLAPPASPVDVLAACKGLDKLPKDHRKAVLAILVRQPEKIKELNACQIAEIIDPWLENVLDDCCLLIRQMALDCFIANQFETAEQLYLGLVRKGFQRQGTYIHLARVQLMQDHLPQARESIARAWRQPMSLEQSYLRSRLLFLRIICAMLARRPIKQLSQRLENELQYSRSRLIWTIQPLLEHFAQCLSTDELKVLQAFSETIKTEAY